MGFGSSGSKYQPPTSVPPSPAPISISSLLLYSPWVFPQTSAHSLSLGNCSFLCSRFPEGWRGGVRFWAYSNSSPRGWWLGWWLVGECGGRPAGALVMPVIRDSRASVPPQEGETAVRTKVTALLREEKCENLLLTLAPWHLEARRREHFRSLTLHLKNSALYF